MKQALLECVTEIEIKIAGRFINRVFFFFQVQVDPPNARIGFDKWIEKDQWYRGGKFLGVFRLHCNRN